MALSAIEHKQGWAVVNLHNGTLSTCRDASTRDEHIETLIEKGVPLTKIHAFAFTEHRTPVLKAALSSPLRSWV